jgi:hypothetical protein
MLATMRRYGASRILFAKHKLRTQLRNITARCVSETSELQCHLARQCLHKRQWFPDCSAAVQLPCTRMLTHCCVL